MRMGRASRSVHLHIESLIVQGLSNINAAAVTRALEDGLMSELQGLQLLGNSTTGVVHTNINLAPGHHADHLGGALAKALVTIIGNGGSVEGIGHSSGGHGDG